MAGLKFETNAGRIDVEGYIDVVKEWFFGPDPLFDILAEMDSAEIIQNLTENNRKLTYDNGVEATKRRVRIEVDYDDRERTRRGKRRFKVSLAKENPAPLDYLDDYIAALNNIQGNATDSKVVRQRYFLFGVMLFTKCR